MTLPREISLNQTLKTKNLWIPILINYLRYLDINSLRNKMINLRERLTKTPVDIFCVDETKLHPSFSDSLSKIKGYRYQL